MASGRWLWKGLANGARMVTIAVGLAVASAANAQSDDIGYVIESPADGSVHHLRVERGGEENFSFRIRTFAAGIARVSAGFHPVQGRLSDYTFIPENPQQCAPPSYGLISGRIPSLQFRVGPLAANESTECTYRVRRDPASSSDLGFHLCDRGQWLCFRRIIRMGSLPDLAVSAIPVPRVDAGGLQFARLTVSNLSNESVHMADVQTGCVEFGGGQGGGVAFVFEYDFPGACPRGRSEACIAFTGQNFSSFGFAVGPIPPGTAASCLVGMRPVDTSWTGQPSATSTLLSLYEDEMVMVGGGIGFDANPENSGASVGVGFIPAFTAVTVELGGLWTWFAASALMVAGFAVLRIRG